MAKLYIDFKSVNSKQGDFEGDIRRYENCINEQFYNLQKTDYCWHDNNQDIFIKSVKKLKYDISEQIKSLKLYANHLNNFYNTIKLSVLNNFNYNYINTIKYDTNYANKAIESFNRVIQRLDWINNQMPSCIVPSDYPYKKVIDNITGATFPYCNEVVRFNKRIAFVNSEILRILNEFYYKIKGIKLVYIKRNKLNHSYKIYTPDLKKVKFEDVNEVHGSLKTGKKIEVDNNYQKLNLNKQNATDEDLERINVNNSYVGTNIEKESATEADLEKINVNNSYVGTNIEKENATEADLEKINVNNSYVGTNIEKENATEADLEKINVNNSYIGTNIENVNASDANLEKIDTNNNLNSISFDEISASNTDTSSIEFQNGSTLDTAKVSADTTGTNTIEFQNGSTLDTAKVSADTISTNAIEFQNGSTLDTAKVSADTISANAIEFQNGSALDTAKVSADTISTNATD